jgi:putative colanic acid biosysnthesis UDP-glucose lipid carrier transferase
MSSKLRTYEPLLMTLHRVIDAFLGAGLFLLLCILYGRYRVRNQDSAIFIFFATLVCFSVVKIYQSWRGTSLLNEANRILLGCCTVYMVFFSTVYLLNISYVFPRRVALTWMITWPALLLIERWTIRALLKKYRIKGYNVRRAVIAGAGDLGERLARWLDVNPWSGTVLLGFFDDKSTQPVRGHPVMGALEELPTYVKSNSVDTIYLALPMRAESKVQKLLQDLADTTASVFLVPDIFFFDLILGGSLIHFDSIPAIALRDTPIRGINLLFKRLEDLIIASIILVLTCPLMLAIAIGIKFTSQGPIIFKQLRYGLNGELIKIYKFRTMTTCDDGYTFEQATRNDPRVTPLGSFLRRTSLDELPQFYNVLQGRMSVVGPRPHPTAMNETFRKLVPGYMLRHKVKPGITGMAQVNGFRGETETLDKIEKRLECDLEYLRRWSLLLDLQIIGRTILRGAWRNNAY